VALDKDPNTEGRLPGTPALHERDKKEERKALKHLPKCILCSSEGSLSLRSLGTSNILICRECRSEFVFLTAITKDELNYIQVKTTGNLKGSDRFIGRKYIPPIPYERISEDIQLNLPGEPPRTKKDRKEADELEKRIHHCPVCEAEGTMRMRNFKFLRRLICIDCRSVFNPIHTIFSGKLKHLAVNSIGKMQVYSYLVGKRFRVDEWKWDGVEKGKISPPMEKVEGSSHGDHWMTAIGNRDVNEIFTRLSGKRIPILAHIQWNGFNVEHDKVMENRMLGMTTDEDDVRLIAVNMDGTLWTAYPTTYHHMEISPKIHLSRVWKAGIEGWLTFTIPVGDSETELTGFDPLFFIHRGGIEKDIPLGLAAFCYAGEKGKDKEFDTSDIPDGKAYLTKEGGWFIPMKMLKGGEKRDPDEYHLRMQITDRKDIKIFSDPGYLYFGTPFGSVNKDFVLPVIVRKDRIKGKPPEIGDSFSGEIWLQSYTIGCPVNGKDLTSK